MAKQSGYSSVSKDIQDIANLGLDRDYNVPMVIAYVHNPVTDELDRMEQPGNTLPTAGNNSSSVFTGFTSSGDDLTQTKNISGIDYQRTFIWTGSNPYTLTISAWVAV
jgi:hypothetical protein